MSFDNDIQFFICKLTNFNNLIINNLVKMVPYLIKVNYVPIFKTINIITWSLKKR